MIASNLDFVSSIETSLKFAPIVAVASRLTQFSKSNGNACVLTAIAPLWEYTVTATTTERDTGYEQHRCF